MREHKNKIDKCVERNKFMKNVKTTVRPETKKELKNLILETIKNEGNECDLNFIDTSPA